MNISVAGAFLQRLRQNGIKYLYIGSGSDTAPIVQAYLANQTAGGPELPTPIISAHETVAIGMAHGYTMATGDIQAVMLHVSVGAANAVCGIINAARAQIPILFTAGRSPIFEGDVLGSRDSEIHWPQEMFDQAQMMRELVKWDYELRDGRQVLSVVDRAITVANASPRAPVYLTLPREPLSADYPPNAPALDTTPTAYRVSAPSVDAADVERVAKAIQKAKAPVFMCTGSGLDQRTVRLLTEICERHAIGAGEARSRYVCFPDNHPLHMGHNQQSIYEFADMLIYLESDVPWVPNKARPKDSAFICQVGVDPAFTRYPIRGHRADLSVTSTVYNFLQEVAKRLDATPPSAEIKQRFQHLKQLAQRRKDSLLKNIELDAQKGGPITKLYATHCINELIDKDTILINEYPVQRDYINFTEPGQYYSAPSSGGLGWGLPAALGVKQAQPDKKVIAYMGDGTYFFANPAACHHAAELHDLPLLVVIFNNGGWGAVQLATDAVYKKSQGRKSGDAVLPLTSLEPLPSFEKYVEASGGIGIKVTERDQLKQALAKGLEIVEKEGRQVLINIIGQG